MFSENLLLHSENLKGLQFLLQEGYGGKVDLIYVDPPFATGNKFMVGKGRSATISQELNGTVAYTDFLKGTTFIQTLKARLTVARDLLSEQGSIYLHTDYKIGHYVKVMMDEVFGIENFRNDITRIKCNPKNFDRIGFGNCKDMILFYTKGTNAIWNEIKQPYSAGDIERLYAKVDAQGERYTTVPIHAPGESQSPVMFKGMLPPKGRHWRTDVSVLEKWDQEGLIEWSSSGNPRKKIYAKKQSGMKYQDIWKFKDPMYPVYPTEKNADLLNLIVQSSSVKNSIVLDFYCGSGTTLKAAADNGRRWIGIDQSDLAIKATIQKLGLYAGMCKQISLP